MSNIALATSTVDQLHDDDMPLLLEACKAIGLAAEVRAWDDPHVDWASYGHIVLRSTWNYVDDRQGFLSWCEKVAAFTDLVNPLCVARWSTDKYYLADLEALGVPIVPSRFISSVISGATTLEEHIESIGDKNEFVVKPTIGSRSAGVVRFSCDDVSSAEKHIRKLLEAGLSAIVQPYLYSVDSIGEINLIYYGGVFSHAIRKSALLLSDGTVYGPSSEFRSPCMAAEEELNVAAAALNAAASHLSLDQPLTYGRVDLIKDAAGVPRVLELDICEPSLSLPIVPEGAARFARVLYELASEA